MMHSGNHSPCHPLTTLLDAARRLQRTHRHRVLLRRRRQRARDRPAVRGHPRARQHQGHPVSTAGAAVGLALVRRSAHRRHGRPVRRNRPSVQGLQHPHGSASRSCTSDPRESHVSEMKPDFAAAHGDVDTVVRHIRAAAATNVYPMPGHAAAASAFRHSWSRKWCPSWSVPARRPRRAIRKPSGSDAAAASFTAHVTLCTRSSSWRSPPSRCVFC